MSGIIANGAIIDKYKIDTWNYYRNVVVVRSIKYIYMNEIDFIINYFIIYLFFLNIFL